MVNRWRKFDEQMRRRTREKGLLNLTQWLFNVWMLQYPVQLGNTPMLAYSIFEAFWSPDWQRDDMRCPGRRTGTLLHPCKGNSKHEIDSCSLYSWQDASDFAFPKPEKSVQVRKKRHSSPQPPAQQSSMASQKKAKTASVVQQTFPKSLSVSAILKLGRVIQTSST